MLEWACRQNDKCVSVRHSIPYTEVFLASGMLAALRCLQRAKTVPGGTFCKPTAAPFWDVLSTSRGPVFFHCQGSNYKLVNCVWSKLKMSHCFSSGTALNSGAFLLMLLHYSRNALDLPDENNKPLKGFNMHTHTDAVASPSVLSREHHEILEFQNSFIIFLSASHYRCVCTHSPA